MRQFCLVGLALLALVPLLQSCNVNALSSGLTCQDFLGQWGAKPKTLRFEGCKKIEGVQSDKLEATYWVPGTAAAPVEHYLVQTYGMAPLRFVCCGWVNFYGSDQPGRSKDGFYKDGKGRQFYISMASEETLLKDWRKITRFSVRIVTYLGEI